MRHEQNDISMSLVQLDYSYFLKFDVNINVILLSTFNDVGTAFRAASSNITKVPITNVNEKSLILYL